MPAPVVPTPSPAIIPAPGSPPAPAADAEAVPFGSLLAAALEEPTAAAADPIAVVSAQADALQSEEGAADGALIAELLPQVLSIVVTGPVPAQTAIQPALSSTPAAAPEIDALAGAKPERVLAAPSPPTTPVRTDAAAMRSVQDGGLPVEDLARSVAPGPQAPDPAKIAAPAAAPSFHPAAPADTRTATEPAASPDRALPHAPTADATVSAVPVVGERAETSARPPVHPVRLDVAAPVGSREFGAEVGNRLVWMATNQHQVAELRLDPPQLGPVEVRMSIANDQASLSITSPHAAVREAIQASLPRLQDMLQGLGISLGSVSVGAEGFGQGHLDHSGLAEHWSRGEQRLSGPHYPLPAAAAAVILRGGTGVIDVYA